MDPAPAQNGSGPLYFRGHYNLESQLDHLVKNHNLDKYTEVILSGCSAGGMACYVKCDYVNAYVIKGLPPHLFLCMRMRVRVCVCVCVFSPLHVASYLINADVRTFR